MLGNYSNKDPCHLQVGSLVKWWIIIKTNIDAHIGKNGFFQVAHSIRHSNMGCGVYFPCVMTKIKQDFHLKNSVKKSSFDLCITMNWRWFMAGKFHHNLFSFQTCIALQTCVPNYTHWFVCMSTLGFEVSPRKPS